MSDNSGTPTVGLVYFSQTDVTGQLVRAAADELQAAGSKTVLHRIVASEIVDGRFVNEPLMQQLNTCDAIIFGSPTYMGNVTAQFKAFADATSDFWESQSWTDKLAAGITSGSAHNGDQSSTLQYLVTLASQHGMIWVGLNGITGDDDSMNRLGCNLGVTACSPDGEVHAADLKSAQHLAGRIAQLAGQFKRAGHENSGNDKPAGNRRMSASKLIGSAPILLVSDVVAAANYYRDKVGFHYEQFWGEPPCFCILERDGYHLMLSQVDDASAIVPHYKIVDKMWNVYFWVDDVTSLYEELRAAGAIIDYELCEQPYGCREFGIQDLDGYDIAFGQDMETG